MPVPRQRRRRRQRQRRGEPPVLQRVVARVEIKPSDGSNDEGGNGEGGGNGNGGDDE
jgi:hypothetical protein